ncbi:MAG: hypothetical protein PHQ20_03390 [Candidatus Moranbacteria bacterium]|nr:hypothetical protein [Candidatus Moranbacteria bacterium]
MNKLVKVTFSSFFFLSFLFFTATQSLFAQANEAEADKINETLSKEEIEEIFLNDELKNESDDSSVTVATVNLYEAEILKQENNKFDLSFLITNREKAQPSIKYAVQLVSKNEEGDETVIDEKIYPEVLNLGENSEIRKKIQYEAPEYLNGKYFLNVVSETEEGLMLGVNAFGEVFLNGNSEYVEVVNSTCFLSVEGEGDNKKYDLRQGVAVKSDEILKLNCEVENHSDEDVILSYSSGNFYRSVFGKKASSNEAYREITEIKSKEKKNIAIEILKENQPQAYDAVVYFKTDKGLPVNNITAHYVLSGKSASIVNLLLDKNFLQQGGSG